MHKISFWRQVLTQLTLFVIGLFVILPIWGMARLAFDGSLRARPIEFRFFPKQFTFATFFKVLDKPYQSVDFTILLRNSLIVSFGAALIAIVLGASLAYAFARFRFPGRQPGLFALLLTAILPPIAFATPLYILLSLLGIRATLLGLTIVYAAFGMPFCIWNMRAAFQSIPKELEEAAFLDGAGNFTTFRYVTLPLAVPSIAVAGLIAFTALPTPVIKPPPPTPQITAAVSGASSRISSPMVAWPAMKLSSSNGWMKVPSTPG